MTYRQLALIRHVLNEMKEGRNPTVSNNEKVDLDYLHNYFDNIISDVEKNKKTGKVKEGGAVAYRLLIEVE